MDNKILIYTQDVGGTKFLAPAINQIAGKIKAVVMAHPLSEPILKKEMIKYYPLAHFFNTASPSGNEITSFLTSNGFSHIFCTLSSPYRDLTNSYLIKISRNLNIPTFGVMDHWKGYDRFFDQQGELSYFPDYIGCIDESCRSRLLQLNNNDERIFVIGHPYLERLLNQKENVQKKSSIINVLIISQPNTADKSFHSIFLKNIGPENIVEKIYKHSGNIGADIRINYRPHPKEKPFSSLPAGVNKDTAKDWEESLSGNDIFIGLDSMMLVEAALAGRRCISLDIPEFSNFRDSTIPYNITDSVDNLDNLRGSLQKAVKRLKHKSGTGLSGLEKTIAGSMERTVFCFEQFVKDTAKPSLKETV